MNKFLSQLILKQRQCLLVSSQLMLLLLGMSLNANAGIGSVWVTAVSDNSISVSWTAPTGDYRLSNDLAHDYMVCHEESGTWATICGGGTVNYTSATSFTITGLNPSTEYKIRVKCHCERRNIWGNWKSPKWRTIGTNKSTTDALTITSYLIAPSVTSSTINVEMNHTNMLSFSGTRICYKKRWNPVTSFASKCQSDPFGYWLYSDKNIGWMDDSPSSPALFTINPPPSGLKKCTQYKIVGFADFTFIGETMVRTSGLCGFHNKSLLIVQDHSDDVLVEYALALEAFYGMPLIDHLAKNYETSLYDLNQAFKRDQQENLKDNSTMLMYLIEANADLYDRWQQEYDLKQAGMSLEVFLREEYPEINYLLDQELMAESRQ